MESIPKELMCIQVQARADKFNSPSKSFDVLVVIANPLLVLGDDRLRNTVFEKRMCAGCERAGGARAGALVHPTI